MRYWKVYKYDGSDWLDAYLVMSETKPEPLFNDGMVIHPAVEEITKEEYDAAPGNMQMAARKLEKWERKD